MFALHRDAFKAIWEPSPSHPVALLVLDHALGLHLGRGQAVPVHAVTSCSVHVSGRGAGERLVALRAVLRLVADDDFLAVSACPVHGTYSSTPQTPRQSFTVVAKQALTAPDPT